MSGFTYTARIAPLGKDISMPGEKVRPLVLDENTWQAWVETPWNVGVWTNHDRSSKVGSCLDIRVKDGWYQAEFFLSDAIERHLPEGLPVGQPMSIGSRTVGESIHLLQEISIVKRGAIPGAKIISRRERKADRRSRPVSAPPVTARPTPRPAAVTSPDRVAAVSTSKPPNKHEQWLKVQNAPATPEWWRTPAGEDAELRRRLDAAGYREGSFELIIEQMQDELFFYKHGYPRRTLAAA